MIKDKLTHIVKYTACKSSAMNSGVIGILGIGLG